MSTLYQNLVSLNRLGSIQPANIWMVSKVVASVRVECYFNLVGLAVSVKSASKWSRGGHVWPTCEGRSSRVEFIIKCTIGRAVPNCRGTHTVIREDCNRWWNLYLGENEGRMIRLLLTDQDSIATMEPVKSSVCFAKQIYTVLDAKKVVSRPSFTIIKR